MTTVTISNWLLWPFIVLQITQTAVDLRHTYWVKRADKATRRLNELKQQELVR